MAIRAAAEARIRRRLQRAKLEKDLPGQANPSALAQYLATVLQGMSVRAAASASRPELRQVARTAMLAWPA